MSCRESKKIIEIFKKVSVLSEVAYTAIKRCVGKIGSLQENPKIKPLQELILLSKPQKTADLQLF